ncbi:MAG: response regulator, partial [Elusimicrobiota bacterium]
ALEFSVHDTGIGITPEQGTRLFSPFSQADATMSRRYGGTGLGLAICKGLVELMGGAIGFASDPGRGTRFWFRLELERAVPETDWPASAAEFVSKTARARWKPRDRMRVLVVDDNATNRALLVRQLKRLGCPAEAVGDGEGAALRVRSEDFGLVLMDCQMPGRDGLETTREIRRLEAGRRRTPIVAISANATDEDRRLCLAAGMDDFLAKPTTLEKLSFVIDSQDRPFDETALASFGAVAGDSTAALARLIDDFLDDARVRIEAARRAHEENDLKACAAAAHAVKGAAAAVGARGLCELARRIEACAKAGARVDGLAGLLAQAVDEVARLAERRPKK